MSDAVAHVRAGLAQLAAQPPGAPVPSPCCNVCRIEAASGFCAGCLRTLDEVASWGSLGEAGRRAVWLRLERRAAALTPAPAPTPTLSQKERE